VIFIKTLQTASKVGHAEIKTSIDQDFQAYATAGHWFRLMGCIVRNAHSAGIAAILEVSRQNPYFEGILSIFPITRNQCRDF
jgi:hypothetical protein